MYRYREFFLFSGGIGTGIGKIWYRKKSQNRYRKIWYWKKVSEAVSEKFGTHKKYWYRYQKLLIPGKNIGIGII